MVSTARTCFQITMLSTRMLSTRRAKNFKWRPLLLVAINKSFWVSSDRSFVKVLSGGEQQGRRDLTRKVIETVREASKKLRNAAGHVLSLQEFELLMQKLSPKYAEGEGAKEKINRSTCSIPRGRPPRNERKQGEPKQLNVWNEDEGGKREEEEEEKVGEMF